MQRARAATVTAIALLASLALAAPAAATAGPTTRAVQDVGPNGQIAFSSYESCCAYDIYVVNPDGTGLTNLTNTPDVSETGAAWSPDGTKIAFSATGDESDIDSAIWVMDADGSNAVQLTHNPDPEFGPDWAPDGARLVYSRETEGDVITSQFDIFTMNVDGTAQTNITDSDAGEIGPAWSPDGDRLVFAAARPSPGEEWYRWEIVTSDPDGTDETLLTTANEIGGDSYEDWAPSWDPTGEMIVWMSQYDESCCGDWDIWAMNEDGSGKTNLTDDGDPWSGPGDDYPTWSPDGTEIAFSSNRAGGGSTDIYAVPAPTSLPPPAARAVAPEASDDGARKIATVGVASNLSWGTASGVPAQAMLTVGRGGTGSGTVTSSDHAIRCGTDCAEAYPVGQSVTLRARAATGSVFAGWSGACSGKATTCVVSMTEAKDVRARFRAAT